MAGHHCETREIRFILLFRVPTNLATISQVSWDIGVKRPLEQTMETTITEKSFSEKYLAIVLEKN